MPKTERASSFVLLAAQPMNTIWQSYAQSLFTFSHDDRRSSKSVQRAAVYAVYLVSGRWQAFRSHLKISASMNWIATSRPSNNTAISYRPGCGNRSDVIGSANSILTSRSGKSKLVRLATATLISSARSRSSTLSSTTEKTRVFVIAGRKCDPKSRESPARMLKSN